MPNSPLLEQIPTFDEIELSQRKRWRRLLSIGVALPLLGVAAYVIWPLSSDWGTTAREYVRRAVAYEEKGQLHAARIELQNALSTDPKNSTIVLQLAHLLERLGHGHAAIKQFDKARHLGAEIDDTYLPWLRALVDTGEHRSVVKHVLASPAVSNSVPHLVLVGNAYLAKGQERLATLAFERALRIDENSALAHVGLGSIALAAGDGVEANRRSLVAVGISQPPAAAWVFRGDVVLAGGELTTALRAFENAVEIDPSNDLAQIGRARVLIATKEHKKANKALWDIERRNPRLTAVRYLLALNAFGQDHLQAAQEAARTVVHSEPAHAPSLLLLGIIAKRLNNLRGAEEYLRRCVAAAPGMTAPRKVLAELLMELEAWDGAIEVLTGALKVEEKDPDVYAMIAASHAKSGRYALATRFFESAASAAPDSAAARMNLGVMLLATGEPGKAALELNAAADIDPKFLAAGMLLAHSRFAQGDFDGAISAAKKLVEEHLESPIPHQIMGDSAARKGDQIAAVAYYANALKVDPEYAPALREVARIQRKQGHLDAATLAYRNLLRVEPSNLDGLIGLADAMRAQGAELEALEMLAQAREASPQAGAPHVALVAHHLRNRQFELAVEAGEEAYEALPGNEEVAVALGQALLRAGQNQRAKTALLNTVAMHPLSNEGHFQLAVVQARLGELDEAETTLVSLLRRSPGHARARVSLGRLHLGRGGFAQALDVADVGVAQHPEVAAVHRLQAEALVAQDRPLVALPAFVRVFELAPTTGNLARLAVAYQRAGDVDSALATLRRWLEKRPEDAHVRFLFAVVLEQSGRSAHAMGQYEQVLVLAPKHIGALNNLAWMLQKQGEPRALALAKGAYQLNSDNPKVADTYGWTLARFGRLQDAMVIFDVARKAFPQDEDLARHHRAVTRVLRGETSVLRDDPVAND